MEFIPADVVLVTVFFWGTLCISAKELINYVFKGNRQINQQFRVRQQARVVNNAQPQEVKQQDEVVAKEKQEEKQNKDEHKESIPDDNTTDKKSDEDTVWSIVKIYTFKLLII